MKFIYIFPFLFLFACSSNSSKGELKSPILADDVDEKEIQKELEAERLEEERLKNAFTTLEFDRVSHDFGKVEEDSENKTVFIVKNTGKQPLVIENVSASCGCTTPTKPEKPIPPGGKDKIEVVFHPKMGQLEEQAKTVTVTSNTEPKMTVLNIKAFVTKKSK